MMHTPRVRRTSCPLVPKMLVSILAPKGTERELAETFDDIYVRWAVPKFGRYAPVWAWGQVVKTVVVLPTQLGLDILDRIYRRAR